jgi:hypothetical protein
VLIQAGWMEQTPLGSRMDQALWCFVGKKRPKYCLMELSVIMIWWLSKTNSNRFAFSFSNVCQKTAFTALAPPAV